MTQTYFIDDITKRRILEVPIESIAERFGIKVNHRHMALCPFHNDKVASLSFFQKNGIYFFKCFGCEAKGNNINFVQRLRNNCNFVEACRWIGDNFGIDIKGGKPKYKKFRPSNDIHIQKQLAQKPEKQPDVEILNWVIDNSSLSAEGSKFLFDERRYDKDVCKRLHIGSIGDWTDMQRFVNAVCSKFTLQRCLASGIIHYSEKGNLTAFAAMHSLLFPFYDAEGNVINIQSRYLLEPNANSSRFLWIPDLKTSIFNLQELLDASFNTPIYISEGVTDCLALLSEGKTAVAIPGAQNFKESYIDYFRGCILFMYPDHDKGAGIGFFKDVNAKLSRICNSVHLLDYDADSKDYSVYYFRKYFEK